MTLLVIGVIVFFGLHMLPSLAVRETIVSKLGANSYKIGFSLISLTGLILIILGFRAAEFVPLWDPLPSGRMAAFALMPIALILVCSADAPNNIKRFVRHPMLIGITLWAAVHLLANGDLASTIIFASFLAFSIIDIYLVESSGRYTPIDAVSFKWDIGVVVIGLVLYGLLFKFHYWFTGMPLI